MPMPALVSLIPMPSYAHTSEPPPTLAVLCPLHHVNMKFLLLYTSEKIFQCGAPAFLHHYTVSLVQWINHLLPALGSSGLHPRMHPHLQRDRVLLVASSCYIGDPNMIPDHQL
jgi:hypothetical protein